MDSAEAARRFDVRADTYDLSRMHQWQADRFSDFAGTDLGNLLDVATGTGLALKAIGRAASEASGIDVSSEMLRIAQQQLPDASFVVADACLLPSAFKEFDTVTCVSAMAYVDPVAALTNWKTVLKEQGRIILSNTAVDGITTARLFRETAADAGVSTDDPNEKVGTVEALERLATATGLRLTRTRTDVFEDVPLGPIDAEGAFDAQLRSGFAGALVNAKARTAENVRIRFAEAISATDRYTHSVLMAALQI